MIGFFCFLQVVWMITPSVIYAVATRRPKWSEIAIWKITCQFTVTYSATLWVPTVGCALLAKYGHTFITSVAFLWCIYGLCLISPDAWPSQSDFPYKITASSWNLNIIAGENLCQKQDNIFVSHHKQIFLWVEFGKRAGLLHH